MSAPESASECFFFVPLRNRLGHAMFPSAQTEATPSLPRPCRSLGLAPMEGVTDLPVRVWMNMVGQPDFAITPFFRVTAGYPLSKLPSSFCPDGQFSKSAGLPPTRPQVMGSCAHEIARVCNHLHKSHPVVDLNFGCPAPKVVGHQGGSGLIRDPARLRLFLDRLFSLTPPERCSIKTRLGFDGVEETEHLMEVFSRYPLRALTLHGRTRAQRYTGKADWRTIDSQAQKLPFDVMASGDIVSNSSFRAFSRVCPHAPRVLIGRGALRNPWIFKELRQCENICLTPRCLRAALEVFVQIQQLFKLNLPEAFGFLSSGEALMSRSTHEEEWLQLRKRLDHRLTLCGHEGEFSRVCLAKLKMLWNSLRSSLPSCFFSPSFLRARSPDEFFAIFDEVVHSQMGTDSLLVLRHQSQHDWIFSGERKDKK